MFLFPFCLVLFVCQSSAIDPLYTTTVGQERAKLVKMRYNYERTLSDVAASFSETNSSLTYAFLENQLLRQRANIVSLRSTIWANASNGTLNTIGCGPRVRDPWSCVCSLLLFRLTTNPMMSLCHRLQLNVRLTRAVKQAARRHPSNTTVSVRHPDACKSELMR